MRINFEYVGILLDLLSKAADHGNNYPNLAALARAELVEIEAAATRRVQEDRHRVEAEAPLPWGVPNAEDVVQRQPQPEDLPPPSLIPAARTTILPNGQEVALGATGATGQGWVDGVTGASGPVTQVGEGLTGQTGATGAGGYSGASGATGFGATGASGLGGASGSTAGPADPAPDPTASSFRRPSPNPEPLP